MTKQVAALVPDPEERPKILKIGRRELSTVGFTIEAALHHLEGHLISTEDEKWCQMKCFARTFFGRNTPLNLEKSRKRIAPLFRGLLLKSKLLAIEYEIGGHRRIKAVKLYEHQDGLEKIHVEQQLERMRRRRQMSEELFCKAQSLLG